MDIEKGLLLLQIAEKLGVTVEVNPSAVEAVSPGAFAVALGSEDTILLTEWRDETVAHELTHFIQYTYDIAVFFSSTELRLFLEENGVQFDHDFLKVFIPHWGECLQKGLYNPEDIGAELAPYYIEYADNGWQLFKLFCKQAGLL